MEANKNFKEIEAKWQKFWEEHKEFYTTLDEVEGKENKYILTEFPYPSGSGLHIGHSFMYIGGDVFARFKRMQGYNVMFPMGWDAFGLPTENYAIKMKRKPQEITKENTEMFKSQMKMLALSFDWSREIDTTDPGYYKWTQWIFIQLFKKGLAYKKEMPINWCPSCKVGLANEEVIDGKCERCGVETSRRNISQWIVKITDYADKLIEGLKDTDFIEKVKAAQINWIDRKEWIDIRYSIEGTKESVTVATTRPDTNYGATFIVLAPEHEIVNKLLSRELSTKEDIKGIKEYVVKARNKSELERQKEVLGRDKSGVFTGLYAINQLTTKRMPIWITDFVLSTVGTGAVVGVPGHDIRDFEFALQYGLEIIRVVVGKDNEKGEIVNKKQVQEEEGMMVNSGFLDGMDIHSATKKIMDYMEEKGWGKRSIRYHLRDWIFSRQHYWGEPIPMIWCSKCGWVTVPEKDLPVRLPEVEHYEPTDTGESPLAAMTDWVKTSCPGCGGEAKRETDTMPNWAGSDWYYVRYIDPHNDIDIASKKKMKTWLPVDVYIGGDEHNTLHLLYSRFIYKFLYDLGVVTSQEPYFKRISHGVILGSDGQRMSKSRGNVVMPDEVADKFGVDVTRMYLMFIGPYDGTMAWNENTLMGVKRFLDRFEKLIRRAIDETKDQKGGDSSQRIKTILNKLINGVTKDIENFGYNTAIAKMMGASNELEKEKGWAMAEIKALIKLMAPIAPYMAEELWGVARDQDDEESVHISFWPVAEKKYLIEKKIKIAVAVNGKVREQLIINNEELKDRDMVLVKAKEAEGIKKWLDGKQVIKEIYVEGKMVNLVVK